MAHKFWHKKRVLITGFEGFVGSHLTKRLIDLGAYVVGLDIRIYRKETILSRVEYKRMEVIKADISNYKTLTKIIEKYKPDTVFHLAAEAIVGICNEHPIRTFHTNIEGTWNLLEICRHSPFVRAVIVASSDKAYGSHKVLPYVEEAPLSGNHPYDVSKSCADLISYMYHNTYKTPVVVTRCGNVFGPGDYHFSRLVPSAMKAAVSGQVFTIRSDGRFTRDYVYINDIIDGYIRLAEQVQKKKLSGNAFNFSYDEPLAVHELVRKIYRFAGKEPQIKVLNEAKYEIKHQYLSSLKARKILGWKPQYSLEEGLKKTIVWYASYLNKGII